MVFPAGSAGSSYIFLRPGAAEEITQELGVPYGELAYAKITMIHSSTGFIHRSRGKITPMSLDIARIKALCFDVDGTLSDTDDLYARKVTPYLPRVIFSDPEQTARRLVMWVESPGNALLGYADKIGMDDEMGAVIDWFSARPAQYRQKVHPDPRRGRNAGCPERALPDVQS